MAEQSVPGQPAAHEPPSSARVAGWRSASRAALESIRARLTARPTVLDGAVLLVATVGALVRLRHVVKSDFPLNDGGLFYSMVGDLQANRYLLPEFTSYNGGDIPFSYPPAGFYIAGVTEQLLPLDLEQVFRLVPLVFSVLTVLAVFLLARSLFGSLLAATAAGLAFSFVPRSFMWLIMGGGVTRAPGLFFALMALYFLDRSFQTRSRWALAWATACSALTLLSHLETAWFLATSVPLFLLWRGRSRFGLGAAAVFGLGAVAFTAPWWGLVLARHGLSPFLAAMESGGTMLSEGSLGAGGIWAYLQNPEMTSEPFLPVFWGLALLGTGVVLGRGALLLPAWWASIILVGTRAAPTFVIVPMALLVGAAAVEITWWVAWCAERLRSRSGTLLGIRFTVVTVLVAVMIVGLASGLAVGPGQGREGDFLQALTPAEVEAIERVERVTPKSAEILVLPSSDWYVDRPAEWLPALTGRVSVATPQGQEWLRGSFEEHAYAHWLAWGCSGDAPRCLELWAQQFERFDYLFVPADCCSELLATLRNDRRYDEVFIEPGGALFARPGPARFTRDDSEVSREAGEFHAIY